MSEVSVATITAAIWTGEPFERREFLTVILISLAGLVEPLRGLLRSRRSGTLKEEGCHGV